MPINIAINFENLLYTQLLYIAAMGDTQFHFRIRSDRRLELDSSEILVDRDSPAVLKVLIRPSENVNLYCCNTAITIKDMI